MLKRITRKLLTPYCWGMTSTEMGTRNESWSQFGEDLLLGGLLDLSKQGTYVDVGAYNATHLSNTYRFYRAGWSGIAIDANPSVGTSFEKSRPRDAFVHSAIGLTSGTVRLARFQCGAFNCLESVASNVPDEFRHQQDTIEVPCEPLATILDRNGVGNVDLLSVDCEGVDLDVLKSSDWSRWRPIAVCVEDHSIDWLHSEVSQYLQNEDYKLMYRVGPSLIFKCNR